MCNECFLSDCAPLGACGLFDHRTLRAIRPAMLWLPEGRPSPTLR
jgi:hypothetical protein